MSTTPPQQPDGSSNQPLSASSAGFLQSLFDFNFNHFITPKIVKIVYIIATVLVGLATLAMIFSALGLIFGADNGLMVLMGLMFLVASPILGLIYLAFARMSLELYYAVIRLSEDVHNGPSRAL